MKCGIRSVTHPKGTIFDNKKALFQEQKYNIFIKF